MRASVPGAHGSIRTALRSSNSLRCKVPFKGDLVCQPRRRHNLHRRRGARTFEIPPVDKMDPVSSSLVDCNERVRLSDILRYWPRKGNII